MKPQEGLTLLVAVQRYRRGQCPNCGTSRGGVRGVEIRHRLRDVHCHTCGWSWPNELLPQDLGEMLQLEFGPPFVSEASEALRTPAVPRGTWVCQIILSFLKKLWPG